MSPQIQSENYKTFLKTVIVGMFRTSLTTRGAALYGLISFLVFSSSDEIEDEDDDDEDGQRRANGNRDDVIASFVGVAAVS